MLLYIHIPFCDSKCFYCSFNSYANLQDKIADYMRALYTQLEWDLNRFNIKKGEIETIFFGGGTPSCVEPKFYEKIFEILTPYMQKNIEITSEANPNSANLEWLKDMKNLGVNRISFGVQSFNDKKLQALNRAHSAKEAIQAVENAAKTGIKNISIDIIYDFYLDSKELLKNDLQIASKLPINHLSSYELTIERGTNFSKNPSVKKESEELGYFFREEVQSLGLIQYEVSNYGKYKSLHNLGYWQHKNYLGVGAGAVGFINNTRYYPHANVEKYIQNPKFAKTENLSPNDLLTEKIFLGLRSCVGVKKSILTDKMQTQADILLKENKLCFQNGAYYNKEYFLSDELALFIMQ